MLALRHLSPVLFAALACVAQAQDARPYAGPGTSQPSVPSVPSLPATADTGGGASDGSADSLGRSGAGTRTMGAPGARAPATPMLGPGTFGAPDGLENVLNSGTPPSWDRKGGVRKVCPPELENRHNMCVPPIRGILTP